MTEEKENKWVKQFKKLKKMWPKVAKAKADLEKVWIFLPFFYLRIRER
jgi:hypothetical protein